MLKNIAKKQITLITLLISMIVCMVVEPLNVSASTFSVSASTSSVSANSTFTVSFGSGTTGQYTCSASGGSVSSSSVWVDGGTGSVTVTAGSSGSVTVTVTAANVSDSSYNDVTGSKSVTVNINSSSSGSSSSGSSSSGSSSSGSSSSSSNSNNSTSDTTTEVEEDTRSSDSKLKALSIEGVSLSPSFESGVTSYTAEVWDAEEITISATKNHSAATVSGTGTKSLNLGTNVFEVVVTAENETKQTYKITVTMKESPTQFVEYDGQTLGIVKNVFEIDAFPDFDQCVIEFEGEEIEGWYCTELDMTVVYLVDENNEEGFYVYEDGVITSKISLVEINGKNYYVFGLSEEDQERTGYVYEEITIGDTTIMGWGFESADFSEYKVIELMSETGAYNEYLYSVADEVFIVSPNFAPVNEDSYIALIEEMDAQTLAIEGQESDIETLTLTSDVQSKTITQFIIISIVLGFIALALIIVVIILARKLRKGSGRFITEFGEDDFEDEYEDEVGVEMHEELGIEMQDESYDVFDTDDDIE